MPSPVSRAPPLRGLGSATTLVLLNGRRLANYAFSATDIGVDLHTIPLGAIDRVEILKDGASALYGSDAIAGVINFVTRSDFQGVELSAHAGTSEAGGGSRTRAVLSGGIGEAAKDGYNVFAVVDHQRSGELAARDRSFSSTSYRPLDGLNRTSNSTFPGNISASNRQFKNPAAPACTDLTVFTRGGCAYDYARQADDLAPSEQTSALARGHAAPRPEPRGVRRSALRDAQRAIQDRRNADQRRRDQRGRRDRRADDQPVLPARPRPRRRHP